MNRVQIKVLIYMLAKVVTGFASICVTLYFSNRLVETEFSNWVIFIATIQFASILGIFSTDNTYATLFSKNELPEGGKSAYFTSNIILSILTSFLIHFFILREIISYPLFLISFISNVIFIFTLNVLRFEEKEVVYFKVCFIQAIIFGSSILVYQFIGGNGLNIMVCAQALGWALAILAYRSIIRFSICNLKTLVKCAKIFAKLGLPVFIFSFLNWSAMNADRYIMQFWGLSDVVTKNYLITTVMSITGLLMYAINQALVPVFYKEMTNANDKKIIQKVKRKILYFFATVAIIGLILNISTYNVISYYFLKGELQSDLSILVIYSSAFCIQVFSGAYSLILNYDFNNWPTIKIYILSLTIQYFIVFHLVAKTPIIASGAGLLAGQMSFLLLIAIYFHTKDKVRHD